MDQFTDSNDKNFRNKFDPETVSGQNGLEIISPRRLSAGKLLGGSGVQDVLTGASLFGKMGQSLASNYPYFYATGKIVSPSSRGHEYLDGLELTKILVDMEGYANDEQLSLPVSRGHLVVTDINLFCVTDISLVPQHLGELRGLDKKGYSDLILRALFAGTEDPKDKLNTNTSRVLAASMFSCGVLVEKNEAYAKKIIAKRSPADLDDAVSECLALVACSPLPDLVLPLLAIGGKIDQPAQGDNFTPLMLALYAKNIPVAKSLLSAGANPDVNSSGSDPDKVTGH